MCAPCWQAERVSAEELRRRLDVMQSEADAAAAVRKTTTQRMTALQAETDKLLQQLSTSNALVESLKDENKVGTTAPVVARGC